MPYPRKSRAAVMIGRHTSEVREFLIPQIGSDEGILQVEAAGVCGGDVGFYGRDLTARILGHENIGVVAAVGSAAAKRWGVQEGDRVALEEYLPCGHCQFCRSSEFRLCMESDASANAEALRYGSTPLTTYPALWGGFSDYMYLHPRSVLHPLPTKIPAALASLALPIGNGYQWAYAEGGVGPGMTVLVLGPGQQGLACVIAAREAGAARVIVSGLPHDSARLETAKALGADAVFLDEELTDGVRDIVGPQGVDLVIDTAAGNEGTVSQALELVRKRGVVVFPASTRRPLKDVDFYRITRKHLTVRGVRGHSYASVEWAIEMIGSRKFPLEQMCSIECGLADVDKAIRGTGGEFGESVVHAAVIPGLDS